jgi:hypothetical protein
MSVILATKQAEIRRIAVPSQPKKIGHEILSLKNPSPKKAGGVAQGVGPEFHPQYHHHPKKNNNNAINGIAYNDKVYLFLPLRI